MIGVHAFVGALFEFLGHAFTPDADTTSTFFNDGADLAWVTVWPLSSRVSVIINHGPLQVQAYVPVDREALACLSEHDQPVDFAEPFAAVEVWS